MQTAASQRPSAERPPMPKAIRLYVKWVDSLSRWTGIFAMFLLFALLGILLYSTIMKTWFLPSLWTVEAAQFVMVSYYLLGGAWTLKEGEHVRMDLLYSRWTPRKKAGVDLVTGLAMIFFLGLLFAGGVASSYYAWQTNEHSFSAWRPPMLPVKLIMTFGIFLTLLQAAAIFFRDWATLRGASIE